MTPEQRETLEKMMADFYSPTDPCRKFMLEAQIPSVDPNSTVLYCPGRDIAYLGDYLIENMIILLHGDDYRYDRNMIENGATAEGIKYMMVRLMAVAHAKGLKCKSWDEAWDSLEEFPVDHQSEVEVLALFGKLVLSAIWQGKRSASKTSADGKTFFSIADTGELVSETARRFLTGELAKVMDDFDEIRDAFYKEVREKSKNREALYAKQKESLTPGNCACGDGACDGHRHEGDGGCSCGN